MAKQSGKMENLAVGQRLTTYYNKKKVFITGHTGFKGSWLTATLHALGATVKGYALAPDYENGLFDLLQAYQVGKVLLQIFATETGCGRSCESFNPTMYFTWRRNPWYGVRTIPAETFDVNVTGTANVLEAVNSYPGKCTVIVITTDKVYENKEKDILYTEGDVIGDVHADRAVAGRRGVERHAGLRRARDHRVLVAAGMLLQQIEAEPVVELRRRDRLVQAGADDEVADVGVGFEQHRRRKQHVVDADDAVFVELDVVDERRAAVQREVQRVVQVVIQVRAGRDDEVDQAAVHHLDDAAAEPGRRHRAGNRQPDRRVVLGREHLLGEDLAGLRQPRRR